MGFFVSSSMGEHVPIELRTVLKTLSQRYELFEFKFIENMASPAHLDDQMRRMIDDCDGIIMIFHKLDARGVRASNAAAERKGGIQPWKGIVKEGVEFELQHAIATERPIFLFTEQRFLDHPQSHRYLSNVWQQASLSSQTFTTSQGCVDAIEQSLFNYIVLATKAQLRRDGKSKLDSTGSAASASATTATNV